MLLLMPAWTRGPKSHLGIKVVTVFPDNGRRSLPSIYGQYLLLDGTTGQTVAMLDGTMLTKRRTACASGLASRYLSRPDARRLADDRHRCPGAAAHPRARQGAADRGGRDLGPAPGPGSQPCPGTFGIAAAGAGAADRRARGGRPPAGGGRGRYHLVCNAFQHASGRRRLAARGPACRPGGRLYAEDARERRRGGAAGAGLCRHPRRRPQGRRRHRPAAGQRHDRRNRCDRRPLRARARATQPAARRATPPRSRLFKSVGAALEDLAAAELAVTAR